MRSLRGQRDRVGDDQLLDRIEVEPGERLRSEDSVGDGEVDVRIGLRLEEIGKLVEDAAAGDDVVDHDRDLAGDVADHVGGHDLAALPPLVHEDQGKPEAFGVPVGQLDPPGVGRDHGGVPEQAPGSQVVGQHRHGRQRVDRNVEEALDGGGVDVDEDHPAGAQGLQGGGHDLGADRLAAAGHALLTGIGEVRNHRGHAVGRRAPERVDVEQQLHEVVVDRSRAGLEHEDVVPPDRLVDQDVDLGVGVVGGRAQPEVGAEFRRDGLGQGAVG